MATNTRSRSTSAEKSLPPSSNEQLVSFNYVKELLSVQESSMKTFLSVFMENCNMRIDNLTREIAQFKQSLKFTQAQVDDLLKQNSVTTQLAEVSDAVCGLQDKLDDLENRSRRNNLCFDGIEESTANETWEQTEAKVKEVIASKMQVESVSAIIIERAHRVGKRKPGNSKPRSVVAKFLNFKDRQVVLNSAKNL